GAFGLIAAYTIEAIGLRGLRGATRRDEAQLWIGISRGIVMRLAPASLGVILIAGLYMMATSGGPKGWTVVALASFVLLAAVGGPPVDRARLHRACAADDRAGCNHREHRAALGAAGPGRVGRRAAMGDHRLHACVRRLAAGRRTDRGFDRTPSRIPHRSWRFCRGLGCRRLRAKLHRPAHRPSRPGRLRGAARADSPLAAGGDVH